MNARLGRLDGHKMALIDVPNESGNSSLLEELLRSRDMVSTIADKPWRFKNRWSHKQRASKGEEGKCQLDHILVRRKWVNSVHYVKALPDSAYTYASDHRPILGAFRLSLRTHKTAAIQVVMKDWASLTTDTDLCEHVLSTLTADLKHDYGYTEFVDAAIHSYDHIPSVDRARSSYTAWNDPALAKVRVKIKKHRYKRSQRGKVIRELNDLDLFFFN